MHPTHLILIIKVFEEFALKSFQSFVSSQLCQVICQQIEYEEIVLTFLQPNSRTKYLLRRSNVPIPA